MVVAVKALLFRRSAHRRWLLVAGALPLCGCWGWIPEDPGADPPPLPMPEAAGTASSSSPPTISGPAGEWYSVEPGDTLFSIAWRFRLPLADLAAWNELGDGSLILVGQRLRLAPPPGFPVVGQAALPSASGASASSGAAASPSPGAASGAGPAAGSASPAARPGSRLSFPPAAGRTAAGTSPPPGGVSGTGKWRWPTQGSVDSKSARVRAGDFGIQIRGSLGQDIVAADSGKVMYAGDGLKAFGLLVIVQHAPQWLSAYGHNEKILVREGEQVRAGQRIATMGAGPGNAAMLHFEIRRNGKPVEPIGLLPPR